MRRWVALAALLMLAAGALMWLQVARQRQATLSRRAGLQPLTWADGLETRASIEGRVLDEKGRSVEGALVVALLVVDGASMRPLGLDRARRGGFRLTGLPAGELVVSASAGGFIGAVTQKLTLSDGQSLRGIELVLRGGGVVLRGTVADAGGGPIAGARVSAEGDGGWFLAESDAAGAYELRLPADYYQIAADADGYAGQRVWLEVAVDETLPWKLQPAAHLRGRVVMAGTGAPVADAAVSASSRWNHAECHSRADGRFEMHDVEPGEYRVTALKESLRGRAGRVVAVGPGGAEDNLVVVLGPGRTISGRVLDPAGAPVADAQVLLVPEDRSPHKTRSDAEGRWRIQGLSDGECQLAATAPGFEDALLPRLTVDRDREGIELKLGAGAVVSGTVRAPGGALVAGAKVEISFFSGMGRFSPDWRGVTDGEGRFRSQGRSRGTFAISAEAEAGMVVLEEQQLGPGEHKEVELTLAGGEPLQGVVRWEDGPPAPHVLVTVMGGQQGGTVRSDDQGRFRFARLLPGNVTLSASRHARESFDSDSEQTEVRLPTHDKVQLTLPRGDHTLRGRVVDRQGHPVVNAAVTAMQETKAQGLLAWERKNSAERTRQFTGGDGRFLFEDLSRGKYTVSVAHRDYPRAEQAGVSDDSDITITLVPGGTLAGVVVDEKPVHDYFIAVYRHDAEHPREATTPVRSDELVDPAFEIAGLSPGNWSLCARDRGGRAACQAGIVLGEGEARRDLRLKLSGACTLRALVLSLGEPAALAQVTVRGGGVVSRLMTDAEGRFEVRGVTTGTPIEIMVFPAGRALHETLTIPDGKSELELVIKKEWE